MAHEAFRFRDMNENDVEECVRLYRQMVDHHREIYQDDTIPYADDTLRTKLKRTDQNYIKIVAEENRRIVGLLTVEIKGRTCVLDEILVAKDKRGKGIGTVFADYAKKTGRERGCTELQVSFAARNVRALNFYHKMGLNCLGMIQLFMPLTEKGREQWYKRGKTTRFLGYKYYY